MIWHPPIINWTKVNASGVVVKNPLKAACGGIFRNSHGVNIGCFAQNVATDSAFIAEIHATGYSNCKAEKLAKCLA